LFRFRSSDRFTQSPSVSLILPLNCRSIIFLRAIYCLSFLLFVPSFSVMKSLYIWILLWFSSSKFSALGLPYSSPR
jgi:hypothetical protein